MKRMEKEKKKKGSERTTLMVKPKIRCRTKKLRAKENEREKPQR